MPKEKGGHEGASSMRPRAVRAIGVKVRVGISKVSGSSFGFLYHKIGHAS